MKNNGTQTLHHKNSSQQPTNFTFSKIAMLDRSAPSFSPSHDTFLEGNSEVGIQKKAMTKG
jgi:hypothetical protein